MFTLFGNWSVWVYPVVGLTSKWWKRLIMVFLANKVKVKGRILLSATYAALPRPAVLYNRRKWQLIGKSQWYRSANAAATTHTTAPINHTRPSPLSIHQMALPLRWSKHPITAYYSVYRPRKDERLSRPGKYRIVIFSTGHMPSADIVEVLKAVDWSVMCMLLLFWIYNGI